MGTTNNSSETKRFNIAVEGNIGCGKSQLLEFLSEQKSIEVFPEPLEKWQDVNRLNFFELFYKDPVDYGVSFQYLVMLTMIKRFIEASKQKDKPIHVFERSLNSSRQVFIQALKQEECINFNSIRIMNKWFDFLEETFNTKPDVIVYIRSCPKKLMRTIQSRGRTEERELELSYLEEIHYTYEAWIKSITNIPVIILNGDCTLDKLKTEYDICLTKITKEYLNKVNK